MAKTKSSMVFIFVVGAFILAVLAMLLPAIQKASQSIQNVELPAPQPPQAQAPSAPYPQLPPLTQHALLHQEASYVHE